MEEYAISWQVYATIASLVAFLIMVGTPAFKLIKTLTNLDLTLVQLGKDFCDMKDENREEHEKIIKKLDNHEGRIGCVEDVLNIKKRPLKGSE